MDNFGDFLDNFEVVDECSGSEDGAECSVKEEPAVPDNKPTEGEIEEFLENVKGIVTCGGLPESEEQTEVVSDDFHKEIRVPEQPTTVDVDEFHEECSDPVNLLTQLPPTSRSINLVDDTLVCTINNNKVSSIKSRVTYKPGGTLEKTIINDTEDVLVDPSPVENESESIREVVVNESLDVQNNLYLAEEEDGLGSSYNVVDSYECVSPEELISKLDEEVVVNEENLSIFGLSPECTVEVIEDLRDHLNHKRQSRMDEVCEGEVEPTNLPQSKPDETSHLTRESRQIKRRLSPCSRRRQSILRSIEERAGGRESLSPAASHSRHVSRSGSSRSFSEASKRPRTDQGTKKRSPSNESLLRSVEKKLESLEREASLIDKALSKSISAERRRKSSKEDWKSSSRDRMEQHRRRKSPPPARYERSRRTVRSPKGHIHSHSSSQKSYPNLSHLPKRSLNKVEETKQFCAKLREIAVGGTMNSGLYCPPGPYQNPPPPYGSGVYTQSAVPGMGQYQGYGAPAANPTYSMHHGGGGYPMQPGYLPPRSYFPQGQPAYPPSQPAYPRAEVPQPWPRPRYSLATSAPRRSVSRSRSRSPKKKKSKKSSKSRKREERRESKERRTQRSSVEIIEVRSRSREVTRKRTLSPPQGSRGPKRYLNIIDPSRIPTPPPPPVLSCYSNENSSTSSSLRQDDSMGTQKQGKGTISLSSLLEAAIMDKPRDGSGSPCDPQTKKDILNNCETIIRHLYQKRTSGAGAFIPDALEEDMQVGVQCSPLLLWHPSLSFNRKTNEGEQMWRCSDVDVPETKKISFKTLRPNVSLGFGYEKKEVAKKCVELKPSGNILPPALMVPVNQPPPLNVPPPVVPFKFDQPPPAAPVVRLNVPPPVQTLVTQPPPVAQVPNYPPPFSAPPPMFNPPPPAMSGYNQSIPVPQQANLVSYPSRITSTLPYYTDTGVIDKTKNVMYPLPSYSKRSEIMNRGRHLEVINSSNQGKMTNYNQEKLSRKSPEISSRRSVEQIHRNKSAPRHKNIEKSKGRSIERRSSERIKGSIERGRRSIERARKSLERSIKRIEEERVSSESRLKSMERKRYSAERGRRSIERARRSMERGKLSVESGRESMENRLNNEDKRKFNIEKDKKRMNDRPMERDLRNIEARRLSDEKDRANMERTKFGERDRESPGRHHFEKKTFNRPKVKMDGRKRGSQDDVKVSSVKESNSKGLNLFKLCALGNELGAIQQKSLLYNGIIESLQKNSRTYKRLYTYQNNVLCKIDKGFSTSVVIPRDNLKEFLALLHKKFHDLTTDEIMAVKRFVYPKISVNWPKVVAKVFSECPNCKSFEPNKVEPLIDKKPAKKLVKAERKTKDEGEDDIDFREKSPRYMREIEDDYSRYDNMCHQIGSTNTPSGYERATKTKPLFELLRRKEPSPTLGMGLHESLFNDAPLVFKNKPEMFNPVVDVTVDSEDEVVNLASDTQSEKPESMPSSLHEEIVISDEEKTVDSKNTNNREGSIESEPDVEIISVIEPEPRKLLTVRGKENPNLVLINTKNSNKPVSTPTNLVTVKPLKPTKTDTDRTGPTSENLKKHEQIKTKSQPILTPEKVVTAEESEKKSADSSQTKVNVKESVVTKTDSVETIKPSSKCEVQKTSSSSGKPSKNIVKESEQAKLDPNKNGQSDTNVKEQIKVESNQIVGNKQEDAVKDGDGQSESQIPGKVEEEKPKADSGLDFKGKLRAMQAQSKGYAELISRLEGGEKDKDYLLKGGMICKKISKPDGRTEIKILAPEDSTLEVIHIVHTMSAVHTPHSKVITFFSKHFTPVDNLESQVQQVIADCAQCKKS